MKKLSEWTKKLTGMAKLPAKKFGTLGMTAFAALAVGTFAAVPAAHAQRFGVAVQLGGPAFYAPGPAAVYGQAYGVPAYAYYGDDGVYMRGYRWGDDDGWRDRRGWGDDDHREWRGDDHRGWGRDGRGGDGRGWGGDQGGDHRRH